jgi:choice-of-anchor B domain-containing protein
MIKHLLVLIFIFLGGFVISQDILNMELLSNVEFGESGNDIWGFVDENGTEYAVMGTRTATRIYSLEDPTNPIERYTVTGAASTWRDIKYYEGFLYVTTDRGSDGLTIIDCTQAPDTFSFTRWKPEITAGNSMDTLRRAHNIYIDTDTGIAYIAGHNIGRRGVILANLKVDPNEPVVLSVIDVAYSHDVYTHNGRLYSSELGDGMAIYDVTDPSNPKEITRQETSRDFCHNTWATLDNKYAFTTDERSNAYMDAYDVSEDGSAIFLDRYRPLETLDWPVIPHNTHILDKYAIVSWYTDGVVITDISKPDNIVKVGVYDTYTNEENLNPNGAWFEGCWGAYPYLPSGIILASDINTGLYVFGVDYVQAARLEGRITSDIPCGTSEPISNARVEILSPQLGYDITNINGEFKTGISYEGTFNVVVSHPSFAADTIEVEFIRGEVTELNITLKAGCIVATVVSSEDGLPIPDAKVTLNLANDEFSESYTSNADGVVSMPIKIGESYLPYFGKWGYLHALGNVIVGEEGITNIQVELEEGYQDDFFADLGWNVTEMAASGNWELGNPVGTDFGGELSNPEDDIINDLGNSCYTTGNGSDVASEDDVDGGVTVLVSPEIKASGWTSMELNYYYWFYNAAGGTPVDDSLHISLTNGQDEIFLDIVTESNSSWSQKISHVITPVMIPFNDEMKLVVRTGDYGDGHLVEAAIDGFKAIGMTPSNTTEIDLSLIKVYPNPAGNSITFEFNEVISGQIQILDTNGKIISIEKVNGAQHTFNLMNLQAGNYIGKIISADKISSIKFVKL